MTRRIPLIGLLEDALLVGEERSFAAPVLEPAALAGLRERVGTNVCAVPVASRVELPSLASQRWATEALVASAADDSVVLRGVGRLRVRSANGPAPPYQSEVEPVPGEGFAPQPPILTAAIHEVVAALGINGMPDEPGGPERAEALAAAVLRAVGTPAEVRAAQQRPLPDVLREAASRIAQTTEGHRAGCTLEEALRKLAREPKLTDVLRRRLWGQVVEIQTRLDVFDPMSSPEEGDELDSLQRKLQQRGLPRAAREVAKRELKLLRSMKKDHHDYSNYIAHLQLMSRLAWHPDSLPPVDLDRVRDILDRDHTGLEKPKQRILEYLAVRSLGGECKSTVLCLVGPPGVGKTTVARAVAEALGRRFVRVALGGIHDECELRGHRMSFQAAAPGRIIAGMQSAGTATPVVLLDEIDKVGLDRSRSPHGALLEILDPEQNAHFQDNYLAVPYDLSNALFFCTANDLSGIPETLRDRLEIIELDGYSTAEKMDIAERHLFRRLAEDSGLPERLRIEPDALLLVIEGYTRESGVRQLTRALSSVHRARALRIARAGEAGDEAARKEPITAAEVRKVLGPGSHEPERVRTELPPGVATGLSVGPHGGAVLFIEVGRMAGTDKGQVRATGRLGEVMRESAEMALAHLRTHAAAYGVEPRTLQEDFHVHVPDGATAKDGPSAGVALVLAMLSSLTGTPLPPDLAVTGEVTLSGRVLPVGGIRAKLLAAERAGARRVMLPRANREECPPELKAEAIFVETMAEAAAAAFGADGAKAAPAGKVKRSRA